ncbi:phosphate propanoyltransferase [Streptococcus marmotae]|uniref:phosphate propanoyltransferase n=1 Tax=Streptococcus marmotae TaxID=1825069 RepID=UPI00082AC71E|nr:phosphate propanoyltransferase [Streptococcus marmotae]
MDADLESLLYKVVNHLSGIEEGVSPTEPVSETTYQVENENDFAIPLGVSNHHVHLSQADADILFGRYYNFKKMKDLSQPGQFALEECVMVAGSKGIIEKVRILGPVRKETQVELTTTDCFKIGVKAPLRLSGELENTPGCTIIGPAGSVQLTKGCIVAKRHIHMSPTDAQRFGVQDNQNVSLELPGERGGIIHNVIIRVKDTFALECHLDTEEANALGVTGKSKLRLIK